MARLTVSFEARSDIGEVLSYLRLEAGADVALAYSDGFDKATDLLAAFPGIGTPRPEFGADARTAMVKPYILIYDYNESEDSVTLLRVVHGRRNLTIDMITRR
jgi:plasmid stabilization system protein ParE